MKKNIDEWKKYTTLVPVYIDTEMLEQFKAMINDYYKPEDRKNVFHWLINQAIQEFIKNVRLDEKEINEIMARFEK